MAGSTAAKTATDDEAAMHSVAAAMRDAAATATEHAAQVKQTAGEIGSSALHSMSRMTYTGSYILAYGVVYAAVFIAQSLPQENPIMHGLRDGGRAAMDELSGG
jgi:microcystin-dependent protein